MEDVFDSVYAAKSQAFVKGDWFFVLKKDFWGFLDCIIGINNLKVIEFLGLFVHLNQLKLFTPLGRKKR